MNHHPVHLDSTYAASQVHGKILVVGTYVSSLVVGQSVRDISGQAIANLSYEKVQHLYLLLEIQYIQKQQLFLNASLNRNWTGAL